MNWFIIIAIGILVLALVVFMIRRNMKDEEVFEDQLKQDYHKPRESDINDSNAT